MPKPAGFKEEPPAFEYETERIELGPIKLKIGEAGRVVIPAEIRAAMAVKPGDTVTARIVNGELHIVSPHAALQKIRAVARAFKGKYPDMPSAVDELLEDRREEARRDMEKANSWRRGHGTPPPENEE